MPIPRLNLDDTALLVIDVQERLMPTIADRDRIVHHCAVLLRGAQTLGMPFLVTEQYVRGLGRTVDGVASAMSNQAARIEKTRFSAAIDEVLEQLHAWRRSTVLLCGVEAHVCVLQTALDLQAHGRQCFVCTDAVSAGQREQIQPALDRMRMAGVVPTGVVSALYELVGDAAHPAFRAVLDLAKSVRW